MAVAKKDRKNPKGRSSTAPPKDTPPPLRLEWRSPQELAENPKNWRNHPPEQISALTDVLSEVGWAGAVLYNERTERIIDGHARRKVALDQGSEKVPVLIGSWDEATEAKILASLDPIGAMASADKEKLDALLRDVSTGSEALQKMLGELATDAGLYLDGSAPMGDMAVYVECASAAETGSES
jgi:ParB-like chromosome segregation protein Spo0J